MSNSLNLTQDGFILLALLAGSDVDVGIPGIGPQTVLALLRCSFCNNIVADYARWSHSPDLLSLYFQELKQSIFNELRTNKHGELSSRLPGSAYALENSRFPSSASVAMCLAPPSAWSDTNKAPSTMGWGTRLPDVPKFTHFCREIIGYSSDQRVLEIFQKMLWLALVMSIPQIQLIVGSNLSPLFPQ
ncbi:hypothetical protein GYMLUDRAFT_252784 [Collybiopsis luxurians FD-317 M1]|uniref:Uncharacterized protein n=1 Tax=Collybiopsis luxurians FD-317 M1 TaxID=944289 RepID=A0A0D0C7B3_9AGAR|nr:hypothetical protein GYMLUDRAFT_252784 [Collybiopsis luxurians FD-317 M1]